MARSNSNSTLIEKTKWGMEALWAEVHAISTGLGTALRSGAVVHGGGVKGKAKLARSIACWGFTAARQVWYSAQAAPDRLAIIDDMGEVTYRKF